MLPSSGAPSASRLTIRVVRQGATTCLSITGAIDSSNRERFEQAVRAIDLVTTTRVELDLGGLDSCDVDAAFELTVFASEVRDAGGEVVVVSATPWVLTMLTIADVAGAVTMPEPCPSPPLTRPTPALSPERAVALRWLRGVLDHGTGSVGAGTAAPVGAGEGEPAGATPGA